MRRREAYGRTFELSRDQSIPFVAQELALMRPAWRASEKFVLVIPIEGLANRLRVVVDALQLAEDMCRSLLLCWQPAPACQVCVASSARMPRAPLSGPLSPFSCVLIELAALPTRALPDGRSWSLLTNTLQRTVVQRCLVLILPCALLVSSTSAPQRWWFGP